MKHRPILFSYGWYGIILVCNTKTLKNSKPLKPVIVKRMPRKSESASELHINLIKKHLALACRNIGKRTRKLCVLQTLSGVQNSGLLYEAKCFQNTAENALAAANLNRIFLNSTIFITMVQRKEGNTKTDGRNFLLLNVRDGLKTAIKSFAPIATGASYEMGAYVPTN